MKTAVAWHAQTMGYQLLANLVMLLHFSFLVYLTLGGFLAWSRPWLVAPHAVAATWGAVSATVGVPCPLTAWEDAARRAAGEQGLSRGFIDTYLTGVVYPAEQLRIVQLGVAALVLISWGGLVVRLRRRGHRAPSHSPAEPSAQNRALAEQGR